MNVELTPLNARDLLEEARRLDADGGAGHEEALRKQLIVQMMNRSPHRIEEREIRNPPQRTRVRRPAQTPRTRVRGKRPLALTEKSDAEVLLAFDRVSEGIARAVKHNKPNPKLTRSLEAIADELRWRKMFIEVNHTGETVNDETKLLAQRERLLQRKEAVDNDLRDARHEMGLISQQARDRGQYVAASTYNKLSERIASLGGESQAIQRQLGTLGQRIKQVHKIASREDSLTFEAIAREMLDHETFMAIQRELAVRRNIVANEPRRIQSVGSALPIYGNVGGMRERDNS